MKILVILILIANTLLLANKLSEKEILEWSSIGVDKKFIENWKSQGVKTPNDAKKWIDAGENRVSISLWKNIKITDPDEVVKWKKTKLSFKDIQNAIKEKITPEILEKWYKEGILYEETILYYSRKIDNLEDAKKWKSYNIKNERAFEYLFGININSLSELEKWLNIGVQLSDIAKWKSYHVNNPEDAEKWIKIGITSNNLREISSWKSIGLNDIEEIKRWKNIDFNSENVKYYTNKGFSFETINSWLELGVNHKEIEKFISIGIKTPSEAELWTKNKIYSADIVKYSMEILNINNPEDLKNWFDLGFSTSQIKQWKNLGINYPYEATEWKKVEDIEYINRWLEVGINNPEEVQLWKKDEINSGNIHIVKQGNLTIDKIRKWRKHGISEVYVIADLEKGGFKEPEEYLPYKDMNYKHAIKLKEWNIKPNNLIKSMSKTNIIIKNEFYFKNKETFIASYETLNGECEEINNNKFFTEVDMSENNNKCFVFPGTMIQRLDEKSIFGKVIQKGIVESTGNRNFFAESFNGEWLEGNTKLGIIKGNGSYTYKSKYGTHVIPQGKVLLLRDLNIF